MTYNGKVALVTGGGSGMGRVAARVCNKAGAAVAVLDVNEEGMAETAANHNGIHTFKVDISDFEAVDRVVKQVESELGPIDRVYNAAAIMPYGKLLDQDVSVIHKMMNINYGGLVNIAKTALPLMIERGKGDFISFASMAGFCPTIYVGAYSASKYAVVAFTEVLYHENRNNGVRFVCVCPPLVNTPLLQQGRDTVWPNALKLSEMIEAEDVIKAIEKGIKKGKFFLFPGKMTKFNMLFQRFFPGMGWWVVHKVEGF